MTYYRTQVIAQIQRLGKEMKVLSRSPDGKNDFGNEDETHSFSHNVIAIQTYPNRNT